LLYSDSDSGERFSIELGCICELQALPSEEQVLEEEKRMARKIVDLPRQNEK